MEDIHIQVFLSLFTAIVGFLIGRADNKLNLKREIQKERFERLYIPFTQLYDRTHMAAAYNFEDFSEDIQKEYVDMLVSNMVYASEFTRNYIVQFMMVYHDTYVMHNFDVENLESINKTFNTVCELIYEEFNYLRNCLYYSYGEKIKNFRIKRKYRRYAKKEEVKKALMNNL